jgi:cell division protein FtsW
MVYSASAVLAFSEGKSTFHYFLLQIGWVLIGLVLAYLAYRIPLKIVSQSSIIVMVVTIVLLVMVLVVGKNLNGAKRWIDLGPFDLQPSEIAKLGFVIYLSAWLSRKRPVLKNFQQVFQQHLYYDLLPFMMLLGIVSVLIILQPDLDTTAIVALTSLVVYFVSGNDALHTLGSIFIVITTTIVGAIAAVAASYRVDRIKTYFDFLRTGKVADPLGKGQQLLSGLIAIGTGGLLGVGFGNSRQKLFYLNQAAFTDSIYAIIAEEFGMLGSIIVIVGFLYFMSLGVNIARRAPDKFSALLAMGITTWITLQAFLNIGANLAVIPFGGIPLPFISYGGSNTLIIMVGIGLLLNIDRAGQVGAGKHRIR